MWGRSGDFLEEVIKAINLEKGVGMSRGEGHTGQRYCYPLPIVQMQTLRPRECKLFVQSHKSQCSLAPTKEKAKFMFGPCKGI